jgi:hypothetical protein
MLEGLTEEKYLELWKIHGNDFKVAEVLHTTNTPLQVWKKENGIRVLEIIKYNRRKTLEQRVKINNEMKKQGFDSYGIYKELGFRTVRSYWNWRFTTKQKGFDVV